MKQMKASFVLALFVGLIIYGCSPVVEIPVEPAEEKDQLADEQNATEEAPISLASLDSGIVIDGAGRESGNPPAPNSNLDFQLESPNQEAFQETGLTVTFSSTADLAGAYIQFKDVEGNKAGEYYDVPVDLFSTQRLGRVEPETARGRVRKFSTHRLAQNERLGFSVGFTSLIPAGQFCYDICLYDSGNNISQIQTVCVIVEAWGGNAEIVGEWVLDRLEPEDSTDPITLDCKEGGMLTLENSYLVQRDEWTFVLEADGSYYELLDYEEQSLDIEASAEKCEAVYEEPEIGLDKYLGKWAFNEVDETLTVIDFGYEDLLDPSNKEEYDEGELYFEGVKVEIIDDQLVLSEEEDGELYKAYFNRK